MCGLCRPLVVTCYSAGQTGTKLIYWKRSGGNQSLKTEKNPRQTDTGCGSPLAIRGYQRRDSAISASQELAIYLEHCHSSPTVRKSHSPSMGTRGECFLCGLGQ